MAVLRSLLSFLSVAPLIAAAPGFAEPRSLTKRCENSATDRTCWGDYDISTNYYDVVPDTGVTREYWFDIVNTTASPDGVEVPVLAVNGSVPGPTIEADWGDTVVVHVKNSMQNNGSSIHFHGIRQNHTNMHDGVPSVTQCPTAPGDSMTYTWRATQYGTSWWHSHFYVQAWDGVFGGIKINGPTTANWDEDVGVITLTDWDHDTADNLVLQAVETGPPTMANGLIDGKNVFNQSGTIVGERYQTTFVSGNRYLLRLVNVAADTHFKFTIDNHTMEVVSTDWVPIVPYTTDVLSIAIGQRYDVIVTANATADNYWMRAIAQTACSDNDNPDNIKGIIRYDSASTADPTSTVTAAAAVDECVDEPAASLVPYVALDAADSDIETDFDVTVYAEANRFYWSMGDVAYYNEWGYPTAQQLLDGNTSWTEDQNVFTLPDANKWVYWIVETAIGAPHPLHLHGHDFWVLGSGAGTYDASTATLSKTNAPRRDVVLLPASGWVAFAFYTDNPGVWVTHCHIAWHTYAGLAVQMVERPDEIADLYDSTLNDTCTKWNAYQNGVGLLQDDSGL